jgi:hypothetical protein
MNQTARRTPSRLPLVAVLILFGLFLASGITWRQTRPQALPAAASHAPDSVASALPSPGGSVLEPSALWKGVFPEEPGWSFPLFILIAFLTSSGMQLFKEHFRMRSWAHRSALRRWLSKKLQAVGGKRNPARTNRVRTQIEDLCAAGSAGTSNLYDLPTSQFCGQISHALDIALSAPDKLTVLLTAFSGDGILVRKYLAIRAVGNEDILGTEEGRERHERLRARLNNAVQRALDDFQQTADRSWKRYLLVTTFSTSLVIGCFVVSLTPQPNRGFPALGTLVLIYAIAGALLAPIAHDLTAGLKRWGRR